MKLNKQKSPPRWLLLATLPAAALLGIPGTTTRVVLLGLLAELVVKVFRRSDRPLTSASGTRMVPRTGGLV